MYFLVVNLLLAASGKIIASNSLIEIPESINGSVAFISLARNELKTFVCKWPTGSGNESRSLVYSNEKRTLNRSRGGDLTYRIYTTCKLSGRYVCQSLESEKIHVDRKLDLLVTNCNPQVRPERDANRRISALPGEDIRVTYRITVGINGSNYPILSVHGRSITTSVPDEKYSFTFDPESSIDYSMGLTVKNVTQEDYGLTVFNLNTGTYAGVRLNLYINPPGILNRTFTYNNVTATISCKSSWYPKSITISKELDSQEDIIMNIADNTLLRKETVQIQAVLPDLGSCTDIGTYKCTITDFRGRSDILKNSPHIDNCAPLLCEPSLNHSDVRVKLDQTASLIMCIKGPLTLDLANVSVSIERDGTELERSRYITDMFRRDESKLYHYLRMNLSDVQSSDHGAYVVNVTFTSSKQSLSVQFNVIVDHPPVLCNNTYNNTAYNVTIGQNETIKICMQTSASVAMVAVNKKLAGISNAPYDQRAGLVFINQTVPGFITVHKHLPSIAMQTLQTYSVKVWFKSGYTLTYIFRLRIIGKLELCEGETSVKVVYVQSGSNAVAHLCVTSNLGPFREIGVNGQVHCVNKFDRTRDAVGVTSHRKHDSLVTDYYIQLHVQNVSREASLIYSVLIRPTNVYYLNISVELKILNDSQLRQCTDSLTKTYILARRSDPVTAELCVLATGNVSSILVNGQSKYPRNMNVTHRARQVNATRVQGLGEHREHMVDIHMWNTSNNCSLYEIEIVFDTSLTWTHVFYFLDIAESLRCLTLECPGGAGFVPEDQITLCVSAYGEIDDRINIDGQLYKVEQKYSSRTNSAQCEESSKCLRYRALGDQGAALQVFVQWDQDAQRHVVIKLRQQDSRVLHNVTMVTTGIVYTFGTTQISDLSTSFVSSGSALMESTFTPLESQTPFSSSGLLIMDSTSRSSEIKSQKSDHSTVVLAAVVISVVAFVVFSVAVCVLVFRGRGASMKVELAKMIRSSNASAANKRESREMSKLLNTTLSSQGMERCLLNLSDYQPSTPSRNTSVTYSALSAEYITPLDL